MERWAGCRGRASPRACARAASSSAQTASSSAARNCFGAPPRGKLRPAVGSRPLGRLAPFGGVRLGGAGPGDGRARRGTAALGPGVGSDRGGGANPTHPPPSLPQSLLCGEGGAPPLSALPFSSPLPPPPPRPPLPLPSLHMPSPSPRNLGRLTARTPCGGGCSRPAAGTGGPSGTAASTAPAWPPPRLPRGRAPGSGEQCRAAAHSAGGREKAARNPADASVTS